MSFRLCSRLPNPRPRAKKPSAWPREIEDAVDAMLKRGLSSPQSKAAADLRCDKGHHEQKPAKGAIAQEESLSIFWLFLKKQ